MLLAAGGSDSVIPIIPAIAQDAGVPVTHAQLLISCFVGGYSLGQIPSGILADRYGRRPILFAGLTLFVIASLLCFLMESFNTLLVARFFQGLGASAGAVLSRTVARDMRSGADLARLIAILGVALSSATVVAPIIGGLFAAYTGWTWLFVFLFVQGLLTLFACVLWIPETHPRLRENPTVHNHQLLSLKECARVFFACKQSVWATGVMALTFFGFMAILSAFGTLSIEVYGLSMAATGPLLSAGILFFVAGNMFSHRLVGRFGSLRLVQVSIAVFVMAAISFGAILAFDAQGVHFFWVASSLYFAAVGLLFPNVSSIALSPLPGVAGLASSILGSLQTFFAFLASLVTAQLYKGDISNVVYPVCIAVIALVIMQSIRPPIVEH